MITSLEYNIVHPAMTKMFSYSSHIKEPTLNVLNAREEVSLGHGSISPFLTQKISQKITTIIYAKPNTPN